MTPTAMTGLTTSANMLGKGWEWVEDSEKNSTKKILRWRVYHNLARDVRVSNSL